MITTDRPIQVNSSSPFKPSPLSFGSPRSSPFRRPSTPNSPPSAASSPSRGGYTPVQSPSKLNQSYTVEDGDSLPPNNDPIPQPNFTPDLPPSPTKSPTVGNKHSGIGGVSDATSKLPANKLREIRESFQVLDRDNDGMVNREDVTDVLTNLGRYSVPPKYMGCKLRGFVQARTRRRRRFPDSSRPAVHRQSTFRPS